MRVLRFALRALKRDWRAGELGVLGAALLIAVGSVTAVGFFTDRARQGMAQQANELLAADLAVLSPQPLDPVWAARARATGLATARTLSFLSVVVAGERTQLAEVKAVSEAYPLRGQLRAANAPYAADAVADTVPARGTVWLEARALDLLGLRLGATVSLGEQRFTVTRVVTYEPDRGGDLFNIAPRLLMNVADVAPTKLLQTGSRAQHRLLVAGDPEAVAAFRAWIATRVEPPARLQDVRDARPELRAALSRAERFLGLAALVSVVLAGIAIATATRRYVERHLDTSAILRCLGATQGFIAWSFTLELLLAGLLASLGGCALGYLAQHALAAWLAGLLGTTLPAPSWSPVVLGLATGLVTLIGFALPPLLRLKDVPPLRVLRRDVGPLPPRALTVYGSAAVALAALMLWQARDVALAAYVLGGTLATLIVFALAAFGLVRVLQRLRARVGVAWRYGLANIARRPQASVAQVVAFGLGIMVMLLLSLVRADLLAEWRGSLPPQAPNHFLINIQPAQVPALRAFFETHGLAAPTLYPMIRGRLVAINGAAVEPADYADDRARRLAQREFNLSYAQAPQAANRVVAGHWWGPRETRALSVEQGLAQTLGLALGDTLTFRIAGEDIDGKITNLREVDWDSFQVNFFVVAPPGLLADYPATFITSVYLSPARKALLGDMVKTFPNVTVIDVEAIMAKVRQVMDRVTLAMEYVFLFTLLAGLVVLAAAIQSTRDERLRDGAILRTLGASRRQLLLGLAAEFVTLGLLAGVLAAAAASAIGYVLATQVFHFAYHANPWVWLVALLAGGVGIGLAGTLVTAAIVRRPPLQTLRAL